jgi:hypothetical protein
MWFMGRRAHKKSGANRVLNSLDTPWFRVHGSRIRLDLEPDRHSMVESFGFKVEDLGSTLNPLDTP